MAGGALIALPFDILLTKVDVLGGERRESSLWRCCDAVVFASSSDPFAMVTIVSNCCRRNLKINENVGENMH